MLSHSDLQAASDRLTQLLQGGSRCERAELRAILVLARKRKPGPAQGMRKAMTPPVSVAVTAGELDAAYTENVRRDVWKRSSGNCEKCLAFLGHDADEGHMDHFFGGSGRRRKETTVQGCWRLCLRCDYEKTHNKPTAAAWLLAFQSHCARRGYFRKTGQCDRALVLWRAKHALDSMRGKEAGHG